MNRNITYLSHTSCSSEEHRVLYKEQLLHQESKPDGIHGRNKHLEERDVRIVLVLRNNLLPEVHALGLQVHVATPQVSILWELKDRKKEGTRIFQFFINFPLISVC